MTPEDEVDAEGSTQTASEDGLPLTNKDCPDPSKDQEQEGSKELPSLHDTEDTLANSRCALIECSSRRQPLRRMHVETT